MKKEWIDWLMNNDEMRMVWWMEWNGMRERMMWCINVCIDIDKNNNTDGCCMVVDE